MSALRITLIVGAIFYVLLWAIALNGASSLVAPLLIPLVLALLVAVGVGLDRYLGITPRKQHFDDGDDKTER
ncbi:MAG TPA: hypothetical protein VMV96_03510 [Acidimicrobiales bacterium]|nr:hypothetical protein [Acidimicrobiales bacterium]